MELIKLLTLIAVIIESVLFSGTIFGWSFIQNVLINENYFSSCNKNATCADDKSQITQINLVFSVSTAVSPALTFFSGMIIDKYGIWFGRTVFLLQVAAGFVLIAASKFTDHHLIFVGAIFLNVGNTALVTVNTSMEKLYPSFSSTFINLISGCNICSPLVMYVFSKMYFSLNISFESIFVGAAVLTVLNHVQTFALTPRYKIDKRNLSVYGYKNLSCFKNDLSSKADLDGQAIQPEFQIQQKNCKSFKNCVLSGSYIVHALNFCFCRYSIAFFWGNLQNFINSVAGNDEALNRNLINGYVLVQLFGILAAPLFGYLMDKLKQAFLLNDQEKVVKHKVAALEQILTNSSLFFLYVCFAIPIVAFYYAAFVFSLLHVCFLYGSLGCFLANNFPPRHFGKLYGLSLGFGGFVALLQYPTTILAVKFIGFYNICIFFACVCFILFLFSMKKFINISRRKFETNKKEINNNIFGSLLDKNKTFK